MTPPNFWGPSTPARCSWWASAWAAWWRSTWPCAHPELVRGLVLVSTTPGGAASTPATERGRSALFLSSEIEAGQRARQALALMAADGLHERDPAAFDLAEQHARTHPQSAESYKRQFRAIRIARHRR